MLDSPLFKPNHILNSCRPPHYQISRSTTEYNTCILDVAVSCVCYSANRSCMSRESNKPFQTGGNGLLITRSQNGLVS